MTRESAIRIFILFSIFGIVTNSNAIETIEITPSNGETTTLEAAISTDEIEFSITQVELDGKYGTGRLDSFLTLPNSIMVPFLLDRVSLGRHSQFGFVQEYPERIFNLYFNDFNFYNDEGELLNGLPTNTVNSLTTKLDTKSKTFPEELSTITQVGLGLIMLLGWSRFFGINSDKNREKNFKTE